MNFELLLDTILEYKTITLFRHSHPDCDALGSQFGLKQWLNDNFKDKEVYCLGFETTNQREFPASDVIDDEIIRNSLGIVLDTANTERIDDQRYTMCKSLIKIDHHPNDDAYGDKQYVFEHAAATCEILTEFFASLDSKYLVSELTSEYLYSGLLTDTLCFRTNNTTPNTLKMGSYLVGHNLDISEINRMLFDRTLQEFKICNLIRDKLEIIDGKIGKVLFTKAELDELGVDGPTVRNYIDEIGHIRELESWCLFTQHDDEELFDGSLRSKHITINDISTKYHGGGHKNATGVKDLTIGDIDDLLNDINNRIGKE